MHMCAKIKKNGMKNNLFGGREISIFFLLPLTLLPDWRTKDKPQMIF